MYNEGTTGRSSLDKMWEDLTVELNNMGPPIRTSAQWRRVWSVYKYNQKRSTHATTSKDRSSRISGSLSVGSNPVNDTPMNVPDITLSQGMKISSKTQFMKSHIVTLIRFVLFCYLGSTQTDDKIVKLLGVLVEQQSQIIKNQESMLAKLDKSNDLLAQIVELYSDSEN